MPRSSWREGPFEGSQEFVLLLSGRSWPTELHCNNRPYVATTDLMVAKSFVLIGQKHFCSVTQLLLIPCPRHHLILTIGRVFL